MPSLYRRILGPGLDTLPATLRKFHDVETQWHGHADFKITRGRGFLRGLIAWAGGLPPAGAAVPMRLRIVAEGEGERWIREFGKHRLESVQRAWNGLMVESFGAITLGFRLVIEGDAIRLVPARAWVLGIPWPLWLAPHGTGIEIGQAEGCSIVARAELPLLGLLVQYEGLVVEDRQS